TATTNVSASANTSVAFTVGAGSISFVLGNGTGTSQTNGVNISANVTSVSQAGLAGLRGAVNNPTGTTGITASGGSSNHLVLTQAQGDNIAIKGFTGTGTLAAGGTTTTTLGTGGGQVAAATIQGLVTLQSNQGFTLSAAGSNIGLNAASSLTALSSI